MQLRLVPHSVGPRDASVWIGAFECDGRPPEGILDPGGGVPPRTIPEPGWRAVTAAGYLPASQRRVFVQTVRVPDLQPGTRYDDVRGVVAAAAGRARLSTLPEDLPLEPEPPFTVLLGSCFAAFQKRSARVGRLLRRMATRADVKLLMGDQVYLDNPLFPRPPKEPPLLASHLLAKYVDTWLQGDPDLPIPEGFSSLLADGATWFLADDHEFWNNHPNATPLLPTWFEADRRVWQEIAESLWQSFQCSGEEPADALQEISVGPLRLALVDTRHRREPGDTRFMAAADLQRLLDWIATPDPGTLGILVLGPTLFTERASWFGARFSDRSLANYDQYGELADAILASPRSLLVLVGDVHFGRVAKANLTSGAELVEIVASPLALVSPFSTFGSDREAPTRFPVRAGGEPTRPVSTEPYAVEDGPTLAADHFTTLELWRTLQSVKLRVRAWTLEGSFPLEAARWERSLRLETP